MYPNPQAALPLPQRASLEEYEQLATDLVEACRSAEPDTIDGWLTRWLEALAARPLDAPGSRQNLAREVVGHHGELAQFARQQLGSACQVPEAQFVMARAHGFLSWPTFAAHLDSLAHEGSETFLFESAVHAVVTGDAATLTRLLREHPDLARMRSTREHCATLLHYVSANGVEGYRQVSPANAAEITKILLDAGAEVDAEADVYGGACTALGLVATSGPPAVAGVQIPVIDMLLDRGARMDLIGSVGNQHALLHGCLANGQPRAAAHLLSRGAPVDLIAAAGLGRLDLVARFFDDRGELLPSATQAQRLEGFSYACAYGRATVVEFLLDHGIDVNAQLSGHGAGHKGLHVAAYHGHVDVVDLLIRRDADLDAIDETWQTPPLIWALTGWKRKNVPTSRYYAIVARLVAAGANVRPDLLEWDDARADPQMMAALTGQAPAGSGPA
jgi:ankyrin repeat protein